MRRVTDNFSKDRWHVTPQGDIEMYGQMYRPMNILTDTQADVWAHEHSADSLPTLHIPAYVYA